MTELFDKSNREILEENHAMLTQLLAKKKPKPRQKVTGNTHFDSFWSHYPIKKGKQAALRAFQNTKPTASFIPTTLNLINDVENRKANDAQWVEGYAPHASTYLNGQRWEDEITPVKELKPTEDPNKQHHPDFDANADTTIGLDPVNPYAEDM